MLEVKTNTIKTKGNYMMKNKEKQIQISESTFINVYKLLIQLDNYQLDNNTTELKNTVRRQIMGKLEAMEKRKIFTTYKTSISGSKKREENRQKYLDKANISDNWRSQKEETFR